MTILAKITGPGTVDDLENGGREAVARAGYQVGEFYLERVVGDGVVGSLDVDDRLGMRLEQDGKVELAWGEYLVTVEV